MLKDSYKMDNDQYRDSVFVSVFNNPNGELVLDYLERFFTIRIPDLTNPNDVYYRLGRQSAIAHIRNIINNAKKE